MSLTLWFWIFFGILIYTYAGYAFVLFLVLRIKKMFFPQQKKEHAPDFEPEVCLFVTAYNEKEFVRQKVENSFSLDYPREKIQYLWITDGSDDGTPDILNEYK